MSIRYKAYRLLSHWKSLRPDKRPQLSELLLKETVELNQVDRSMLYELVFGTVRWLKYLEYVTQSFLRKKKAFFDAEIILCLGAYEILFMRTPPYASVHEWVEVTKSINPKLTGLINAILRRILTNSSELKPNSINIEGKSPVENISIKTSHPEWLVERWIERHGYEFTLNFCNINNTLAPFSIRVNTLKITPDLLYKRLTEVGISVKRSELIEEGLIIDGIGYSPQALPFFNEGHFVVQDEASQLVSRFVAPKEGEIILDLCAGMGGKTTHLAQLTYDRAKIYAYDKDTSRVERLKELCHKLGIVNVHPVSDLLELDASSIRFDVILIDAPCSGFGTIRRHPDIKWNKTPKAIESLKRLQLFLLNTAKRLLKPSGRIVYSVCTNEREETMEVVENFLQENREFSVDEGGIINLFSKEGGHDGFFLTRLVRG